MVNYEGKKVIVRGSQSGVYYGTLVSREGQEVEMADCRNIWYWSGAATLLQLATEGVKNPDNCNISMAVKSIVFTDICEIIEMSDKAVKNLDEVKPWKIK